MHHFVKLKICNFLLLSHSNYLSDAMQPSFYRIETLKKRALKGIGIE